jgi:DNA-binding IscR family transcriptional regulator
MGAGGGYYMIKSPSEVMISNVIRLTDGPIALVPCASLNFYEACGECADEATCSVRSIAKEVRDVSLNILSNTSIADLINREQQLKKTAHKSDRKKGRKK